MVGDSEEYPIKSVSENQSVKPPSCQSIAITMSHVKSPPNHDAMCPKPQDLIQPSTVHGSIKLG